MWVWALCLMFNPARGSRPVLHFLLLFFPQNIMDLDYLVLAFPRFIFWRTTTILRLQQVFVPISSNIFWGQLYQSETRFWKISNPHLTNFNQFRYENDKYRVNLTYNSSPRVHGGKRWLASGRRDKDRCWPFAAATEADGQFGVKLAQ